MGQYLFSEFLQPDVVQLRAYVFVVDVDVAEGLFLGGAGALGGLLARCVFDASVLTCGGGAN